MDDKRLVLSGGDVVFPDGVIHGGVIIIEGGSQTLQLFIDEGLWDEARVFTGVSKFNEGIKAPEFSRLMFSEEHIENDILRIYMND